MKKKVKSKVIAPNVVGGGVAVPLGNNKYLMRGRKHEQGGIDIGKNPKTGLEVEDGEVIKTTNNDVKVYSSMPILNGESPAQKVLGGADTEAVFKQQERFKDINGLEDDGTKTKKRMGGKVNNNDFPTGKRQQAKSIVNKHTGRRLAARGAKADAKGNTERSKFSKAMNGIGKAAKSTAKSVGKFLDNNDITGSDIVGTTANVAGSLISYASNKNSLKRLKAPTQPVARKANKLKTTINIQPQLDQMRESVASYTRAVNNNTASSRVALARNNRARLAGQRDANQLYGAKENAETQLINQDRLNQQQVANESIGEYNAYRDRVTAFNNGVTEARGENTIGLISGINSSIQDGLARREKRQQFEENVAIMAAANPNVSDELLETLGVNVQRLGRNKRKKTR